jgi:hypothetical protein
LIVTSASFKRNDDITKSLLSTAVGVFCYPAGARVWCGTC